MILPKEIEDYMDEINEIVHSWPVDYNSEDVIKWILQFESSDFHIALRILKNLIVLGNKDIKRGLEIANSKLHRRAREYGSPITLDNTLFAGVGDGGKSGWMIAYHFRMTNSIPEFSFLSEEILELSDRLQIDNLVMIDDFIGSGNQATKEIEQIKTKVMPLGVKNFFMLSVAGMKDGIRKIENDLAVPTFCAFEYDSADTVMSFDSGFYNGLSHSEKESVKEKLKTYGLHLSDKRPLGYGDTGGLLAFNYNTPNNTLPLIWSSSNGWIPLLRRIENVPNIDALIPKLRKINTSTKRVESIKIYVEGINDEIFFRSILENERSLRLLGVSKIDITSLGSSLISQDLMIDLFRSYNHSIFLLEEDTLIKKGAKKKPDNLDNSIIYYPSIFDFVKAEEIEKIASQDYSDFSGNLVVFINKLIGEYEKRGLDEKNIDYSNYKMLDSTFYRMSSLTRKGVVRSLSRIPNTSKIDDLINKIKEAVESQAQK